MRKGETLPEIFIGVDSKNFEINALLHKNVLVSGNSNSGKTLLLTRLAEAYIEEGVPLILLDTVYEHKGKSLIAHFEQYNKISAEFDEDNVDYAKIGEGLKSAKPVVAINLSKSLEASNAEGIEESIRKAIRANHINRCGSIIKSIVDQACAKGLVIISDEVDYPKVVLDFLLGNKSLNLVMVPNELKYDANFDIMIVAERPHVTVNNL